MSFSWLPPLILRADFSSDQEYIDALYSVFKSDFLDTAQQFNHLRIGVKRLPPYDGLFSGKGATFRHLITDGKDEASRSIVPERCERIAWMLPMIHNHHTDDVLVWENARSTSGKAYVLALADFSYKLVLSQRSDFLLLWTQFPVVQNHSREKLRREYETYRARIS